MKKLFPQMMDCMSGGHIFCAFAMWILIFIVIPAWLPLIGEGFLQDETALSWMETIFCALTGGAMLLIMKEHLSDAFLGLQINTKKILKTSAITLALMAAWFIICADLMNLMGMDPMFLVELLPLSPTNILMLPGAIVNANPVFGLLCMTLLVPFGVCGMFYAAAFAPVCTRNTWAGYLVMAGVVLVAALFDGFWYWGTELALVAYMIRLPLHLVACWSYQKTDNVWTPIFALIGFNLLTSIAAIAIF